MIRQEGLMILGPIMWVIIGLIAGWAAGKIMKGSGYGVVMDIILGIVGAVVGGWLMGLLGIYSGSLIGSTIIAIIGAMFLIWLSRLLKKA
jgi:uncharacterized membrane protein YeaQ/YmgE (transglycosylase-associated protein family)